MLARPAVVAGSFYPADPETLNRQLELLLQTPDLHTGGTTTRPKALIVPHAGYIYSGQTAGIAYRTLKRHGENICKVILLGLSHHLAFCGIATSSARQFETPLGAINIDRATIASLKKLHLIIELDDAHHWEHSLEVQLPFLQKVLNPFKLIPLATGDCSAGDIARCLDALWGDGETLVVVSSDLSHFHSYRDAQCIDKTSCERVLQKKQLSAEQACGYKGVNGLLKFICARDFSIELLDYRNSGDTAGDKQRVVGYGAFAIYPGVGNSETSFR